MTAGEPEAGKMVVTRSARPQAGVQAASAESSREKVGDRKVPSFLLAASQGGAQRGEAVRGPRAAWGGAAEKARACRALLCSRHRAKPLASSSVEVF